MKTSTLLVVVLALCSACHKQTHNKASLSMPPLEVEVATAQLDSLCDQITFSTTLTPLYSATIEPRVSGFLISISYKDGGVVRKGDPLFSIDQSSYSAALLAAEAQQQQSVADLALARSNYEIARPLSEIEAISQMDLDQYHSSYKAAVAQLNYANQQVVNNRLNLDYTTIKAPISGVVAATAAKEGDFVGVGTNFAILTTIDYIDTMEMVLAVPTSRYLNYARERSYDNPKLLSDIRVTLANGEQYNQPVEYYYTEQSEGKSSSTVIVARVANPDGLLKSGMFARVRANIGEKSPRIVIPQRCVSQMQGINSVWVVGRDSTVSLRLVSLGSTYGDMWAVESGVEADERVLMTGQIKVHQGSKVKF